MRRRGYTDAAGSRHAMQPTSNADGTSREEQERGTLSYRALAAIVDASNDAIVTTALDGTIVDWSDGAQRMLGFTRDEAVGQRVDQLIGERRSVPDSAEAFHAIVHRKDGSTVPVFVTLTAIRDDAGTPIGVTRIARDVSLERAAQSR